MNSQERGGERIPPQAIEAEMAVLGAMLIEKEAVSKAVEILDETCFYKDAHRRIFLAALHLYEKNEPVDLVTLSEELKKRKQLEEVGGGYYLTELAERVPSAANVEYHAKIVFEKGLMRKLINVATEITTESYEAQREVYDLIDKAEQKIFTLSEKRLRPGFTHIDPILHETFETIESFAHRKGGVTGIPTGYEKLDEKTSGFQKADLIIIAGRPAMGKTAFSLNIARNVAVDSKIPVGIFSLEMSRRQLTMRLLCSEARIDSHRLRTGKLSKEDWPRLSMHVGQLAESPIFVDDTPAPNILEIRAKARRLKAEHDLGLIIIDYLQLIQGPPNAENRQQEISLISRSLKALAKELDIPVIALSQLSRAVESRGGERRPILSDLRESGALEQDADVILFLLRPELYGTTEEEGIAEIIIGKQRNGPTGTIKLAFLKEYTRFENLSYVEEEFAQPF